MIDLPRFRFSIQNLNIKIEDNFAHIHLPEFNLDKRRSLALRSWTESKKFSSLSGSKPLLQSFFFNAVSKLVSRDMLLG